MNDAPSGLTQAEAFGLRARPAPMDQADTELFVREAVRGGRRLCALRCVRRGSEYVVECTVEPQVVAPGTPPRRLSYLFADDQEARRFVDEAALALLYRAAKCPRAFARGAPAPWRPAPALTPRLRPVHGPDR